MAALGLLAALLPQATLAQGRTAGRRLHYINTRPYYRGPARVTLGAGAGFYNGDLTSSLGDNLPGPSLSLGVLSLLRPHWLIGGELSYVQLGAKDYLPERNYAFRGRNGSVEAFVRYELLRDESEFAEPRRSASLVKPYLKTGVGVLMYNPKSYVGPARPTEYTPFFQPERNDYPAMAIVVPVGLGLTLRLTDNLNASLEAAYYFTTTDYLDDISQRANPNQKDGYGRAELKLEYALW